MPQLCIYIIMNPPIAIYIKSQSDFKIIWNTGIKCTYDCSYCPDFRHNVNKEPTSKEELLKTADFISDYCTLLHRYTDIRFSIDFTGGEPTAQPHIFEVAKYLYDKLKEHDIDFSIGLTTNGFFSEDKLWEISRVFKKITISYHAEASEKQKKIVRDNFSKIAEVIYDKKISDDTIKLKRCSVNVMMHEDEDLFAECTDIIDFLKSLGFPDNKIKPRTIDRHPESQSTNRTATPINNSRFGPVTEIKKYDDHQTKILQNLFNRKDKNVKISDSQFKKIKTQRGDTTINARPCCSGDTLAQVFEDGEIDTKTLSDRHFQGWSCLVAQEWLNIEQDLGEIYSHQTCKANFNHEKGPIGYLKTSQDLLNYLESHYSKGLVPTIKCPNDICGCGICTPKSKSDDLFAKFVDSKFPGMTPSFNQKD